MNGALKSGVLTLLRWYSPTLSNASILMYHSVAHNDAFFTVTPEDFQPQINYLVAKKYNVISLSELIRKLRAKESLKNIVCLTFDDGYTDFKKNAFPILKAAGFPATVFIATGMLDQDISSREGAPLHIMSESDIKELEATGLVEFMPHTVLHKTLTALSKEEAQQEIGDSRSYLENLFQKPKAIFAYPKGKYNQDHLDILHGQGFAAAVTVHEGLVKLGDKPFELKRNAIDSATTFSQFKAKVSGAIELFIKLKGQ